ncbi:MAG: hypothetical protein R3300_00635 [Candidatus Promineifilaceae bacterium]|nr:hypothetical protein [Candidatus Promineifilaceae bacterium]
MRHFTMLLVALLLVLGAMAGVAGLASANGQGVTPEKLENAGWDCFSHIPGAIHCVKDFDALLAGEEATHVILAFDSMTGEFWGAEFLIRQDLYHGQPCPQDKVGGSPGPYIDLSSDGLNYFVCHHFDSPLT